MTGRVVVVGVGNPFRRDDGAGPAVVDALRGQVPEGTVLTVSDGEPGRMLDLWDGQDTVVVAEAVRAHPAHPGRLHTMHAERAARHAAGSASTHGLGLSETLALAGALDRLPRAVVVHAVEGADFGLGSGLSAPVSAALGQLTRRVARSVREAHRRTGAAAGGPPG